EDAAEPLGVELDPDLVPDLGLRIELARLRHQHLRLRVDDLLDDGAELEQLDLPGLVVEAGLDLLLGTELLARRLAHRLLDGAHDDLAVDALVLGDLVDFALERDHDASPVSAGRGSRGGLPRKSALVN